MHAVYVCGDVRPAVCVDRVRRASVRPLVPRWLTDGHFTLEHSSRYHGRDAAETDRLPSGAKAFERGDKILIDC